jgi:hypothetical protein
MREQEALPQIARSLKEIEKHQSRQTRLLEILSHSLLEQWQKPPGFVASGPIEVPPVEEPKPKTKIYGWSMAASVQREGGLKAGDVKIEQDESRWVWIGPDTGWERVEEPSATESD